MHQEIKTNEANHYLNIYKENDLSNKNKFGR